MANKSGFLRFSEAFPDEQSCIQYFEKIRWPDGVVSPFDSASKVYKCKGNRYKCRNTGKYFDYRTGTAFANSKLPFRYWFYAIFLCLSHKRGVSSCQLARDLGVTQKTAWRMLNKIRSYMHSFNDGKLSNEVEIDETFVGGRNKNRHRDKRVEKCQGRSFKDKVPVFGMLQRGGVLIARVVPNTQANTLAPIISEHVEDGTVIYTDGWEYGNLSARYGQRSVDHGHGFYGTSTVTEDGEVVSTNTNSIENAWAQFKRTVAGTYFHISKKHMQKYVDEFAYRFNTRGYTDNQRFGLYLRSIA